MAKFLIVTSAARTAIQLNKFNNKFAVEKLAKRFKCKNVFELSRFSSQLDAVSSMSGIEDYSLAAFARALLHVDSDVFNGQFKFVLDKSKIFVLSDDADIKFVTNVGDDVLFKVFELNQESLISLVYQLEEFDDLIERISKLSEAKDLWESLRNLEYDLDLNLVTSFADDSIDEEVEESESELESLKTQINEVFDGGWA